MMKANAKSDCTPIGSKDAQARSGLANISKLSRVWQRHRLRKNQKAAVHMQERFDVMTVSEIHLQAQRRYARAIRALASGRRCKRSIRGGLNVADQITYGHSDRNRIERVL